MKNITTLTITALMFTNIACAQSPVFTTLNTDGKNVFAGVKLEQKGLEPETYLLEVSGDKLSSQKVSLPAELMHREVVALLPAEKEMLVVLTQRTVEQGDRPIFHSYNSATKQWIKLAEVDCISFAQLKVETSAVTFNCSETNKKGEEVETQKKIILANVQLKSTGKINLPLVKVDQNNLKAELIGETFEWKELKVGANKNEKVFKP